MDEVNCIKLKVWKGKIENFFNFESSQNVKKKKK